MSKFDFNLRLERLMARVETSGLRAIILNNTRNIYWVSGSAQASQLIVPACGSPLLMVKRNIDLARRHSWFPDEWIVQMKATKDVVEKTFELVDQQDKTIKVGMELSGLPTTFYFKYKNLFGDRVDFVNISGMLRDLRMVKDGGEIAKIVAAAKVAEKTQEVVYENVVMNFKPGLTERDVAAEMVYVAKKNRSEHYCIYDNNNFTNFNNFFIVASGASLWMPSTFPIMSGSGFSPAIPYGPSDRELKDGDIVVCDYAVLVDGYHADHARTYVVNGNYPRFFKERYLNLLLAYQRALDSMTAGVRVEDFFKMMREELKRIGDPEPSMRIERYFQGNGTYFQALGHGIGLELDEPPFVLEKNDQEFEKHMVLSIEPKIMIPGWGAINFEDDFIIKSSGAPEMITKTRYLEF
ncbi:MAG: M24 family metallopeptidase [Promethearchaeota archaeon]